LSLLFKPSILVEQLASTHGTKLQHLAIMLNNDDSMANNIISRRLKIKDFKDFTQLQTLQIDTRILLDIRA
jgi:hypothetical protein